MPTGYTADIADGKNITFADFALSCARAFGACIDQRDNPHTEKPKLVTKDHYYSDILERLKNWTPPTKEEFEAYVQQTLEHAYAEIEKRHRLRRQYAFFLEHATNWTPPSKDHENLKRFMIEQLNESMKFDCSTDYYEETINTTNTLTYEDYIRTQSEDNKRDIEYYTKKAKDSENLTDNRNEWIKKLYESLNVEMPK